MIEFFVDPVLRAPTIGCILMGLISALVGVIAFVRKKSLLGETLSHATYPGVAVGVVLATSFGPWVILLCSMLFAFAALWAVDRLEHYAKERQDSALCFVLAGFFGMGVTVASRIQFTHPVAFRQIEAFLYGQAATLNDQVIPLYLGIALLVIVVIASIFKELQVISFDRQFAASLGVRLHLINFVTFLLLVMAIVVGIRGVGVVLMSAMLIAPPVAARQFTNRLSHMFVIAGIIGVVGGYLGNVISVTLSMHYAVSLPTGPVIVLVMATISLMALLFAPKRGVVLRLVRVAIFRYRCLKENLLKSIWRHEATLDQLAVQHAFSKKYLRFVLASLIRQGWVVRGQGIYQLTTDGRRRAEQIVRLHRLWELYLVDYLGVGAEKVHRNAEEMEHILTPEIERDLTQLLQDPQEDPHAQPIPPRESLS